MVVNSGSTAGVQHRRSDVVAPQRNALAGNGHLRYPRLVLNGNHEPCAIGLVAEQPRIDNMQASGQFVGHRCKHLRRARRTRDQGRDPPQRALLLREHAELIMACLDLPAVLTCLGGARPGQVRQRAGHQRDD